MRLFGKKDVYEAPVAQVIDFESDYVMAVVSPGGAGAGGGGGIVSPGSPVGSKGSTAIGYTTVFSVGSDDRDF